MVLRKCMHARIQSAVCGRRPRPFSSKRAGVFQVPAAQTPRCATLRAAARSRGVTRIAHSTHPQTIQERTECVYVCMYVCMFVAHPLEVEQPHAPKNRTRGGGTGARRRPGATSGKRKAGGGGRKGARFYKIVLCSLKKVN